MSIKQIQVLKPKNKIYYCSWGEILYLTKTFKNLNIISIGDAWSNIFKPIPCNKRLIIDTVVIPSDMTEEDFIAVDDFIKDLNGESLVVHCEFATSRSPWLTRHIVEKYCNYTFERYMLVSYNI